jgi:hypothetical protein
MVLAESVDASVVQGAPVINLFGCLVAIILRARYDASISEALAVWWISWWFGRVSYAAGGWRQFRRDLHAALGAYQRGVASGYTIGCHIEPPPQRPAYVMAMPADDALKN